MEPVIEVVWFNWYLMTNQNSLTIPVPNISVILHVSQNLWKWEKCVAFLICISNFYEFKSFFKNNTWYNFCVLFCNLKRSWKKKKIRSSKRLPDIQYLNHNSNAHNFWHIPYSVKFLKKLPSMA